MGNCQVFSFQCLSWLYVSNVLELSDTPSAVQVVLFMEGTPDAPKSEPSLNASKLQADIKMEDTVFLMYSTILFTAKDASRLVVLYIYNTTGFDVAALVFLVSFFLA